MRRPGTLLRVLGWSAAVAAGLVVGYAGFRATPWPSALPVRRAFDRDAERTSQALEKHVPTGIAMRANERYLADDRDALLDVFFPADVETGSASLPTIMWIHGGGWVSGSKDQIGNYARILAGYGFTVAGIDYALAPGATYPTPVRQASAALGFLAHQAQRLHVDPSRLILAGDSSGAHIAAQVANLVTSPDYARRLGIAAPIRRDQLAGALLFCGVYDVGHIRLDGPFGGFLSTVLWSYSGTRNFATDTGFATASVIDFVTGAFPPAFVSAGNADPLLPQSLAFADALTARGVRVDRLFFPADYAPALPHEYQFNLDADGGRTALERAVTFVKGL